MIWPEVAAFRIVDNATILVESYPETPETFLAFPILGPVMAWVLQKRGLQVLHASAVEIGGRSAVFMGDKMAGKSTTAAAFVRSGHKLITDDLLAIDLADPHGPMIRSAFAQIKLDENAADAVRIDGADALPLAYEGFTKRQHKLPDMFSGTIGADHFFVLSRGGDETGIMPLSAGDDLRALMRFGYSSRFGSAPYTAAERAADFRNCAALTKVCSVNTLTIPHDLGRLQETVEVVARHLSATAPDAGSDVQTV